LLMPADKFSTFVAALTELVTKIHAVKAGNE
jgi:hypothetical protein